MISRPMLGSGAVYPVFAADILVKDFEIPDCWPRAYGIDVGWSKTAAIFGAYDRDNDIAYLTSEHYRGQAEPIIHAEGIKARGAWGSGFIDPAANGRSQVDGSQLLQTSKSSSEPLKNSPNFPPRTDDRKTHKPRRITVTDFLA